MRARFRFSEVVKKVGCIPGYYEIWTLKGVLLKVGVAADLCKRLTQHGESLQRGLKGFNGKTSWVNPSKVRSKRSILAKHLYFDSSIAPGYDLRREADRQKFLEQDCRICFKPMVSRAAAREYERERERTACIRYVGRVIKC